MIDVIIHIRTAIMTEGDKSKKKNIEKMFVSINLHKGVTITIKYSFLSSV